jgi:hypothetical protein
MFRRTDAAAKFQATNVKTTAYIILMKGRPQVDCSVINPMLGLHKLTLVYPLKELPVIIEPKLEERRNRWRHFRPPWSVQGLWCAFYYYRPTTVTSLKRLLSVMASSYILCAPPLYPTMRPTRDAIAISRALITVSKPTESIELWSFSCSCVHYPVTLPLFGPYVLPAVSVFNDVRK